MATVVVKAPLLALLLVTSTASAQPAPLPPGAVARLGDTGAAHGQPHAVAMTDDGALLAVTGRDSIELREVGGRLVRTLRTGRSVMGPFAFSPDGKLLAQGNEVGDDVVLWDVATGTSLRRLPSPKGSRVLGGSVVSWLCYSPDGQLVARVRSGYGVVDLWSVADGALVRTFDRLRHPIAFSPDGRLLAAGSDEGLGLWDPRSGERVRALPHDRRQHSLRDSRSSVAFSPDGVVVAATIDGAAHLWTVASGEPLRTIRRADGELRGYAGLELLRFSADGQRLIAGGTKDPQLRSFVSAWDVSTGALVGEVRFQGYLTDLAGSRAEGPIVALLSGRLLTGGGRSGVRLLEASPEGLRLTPPGAGGSILSTAFTPDGRRLAAASVDGTVTLWDVAARRPERRLEGHQGVVVSLAISTDGTRLASGSFGAPSEREPLRLWDASTGQPLWQQELAGQSVRSVAFSPDGATLACAATGSGAAVTSCSVTAWSAAERTLSWRRDLPTEGVSYLAVAASPDGRTLAVATKEAVTLLALASGEPLHRFPLEDGEGHPWKGGRVGLAFSPDGALLAVAQGAVVLYDLPGRRPVKRFGGDARLSSAVAFSPDGALLASAANVEDSPGRMGVPGAVELWDLAGACLRRTFEGHEDKVWTVAFSPDGRLLASGGADMTVLLWKVGE